MAEPETLSKVVTAESIQSKPEIVDQIINFDPLPTGDKFLLFQLLQCRI